MKKRRRRRSRSSGDVEEAAEVEVTEANDEAADDDDDDDDDNDEYDEYEDCNSAGRKWGQSKASVPVLLVEHGDLARDDARGHHRLVAGLEREHRAAAAENANVAFELLDVVVELAHLDLVRHRALLQRCKARGVRAERALVQQSRGVNSKQQEKRKSKEDKKKQKTKKAATATTKKRTRRERRRRSKKRGTTTTTKIRKTAAAMDVKRACSSSIWP
eukprot:COSAG05_NODE_801_length_7224_cov_4.552000_6_plen_217_part_00